MAVPYKGVQIFNPDGTFRKEDDVVQGRSFSSNLTKMLKHMDKLEAIQQGKPPSPVMAHISLTNACNLTCSFCCFANRDISEKMPTEMVLKALDSFRAIGVTGVEFTGKMITDIYNCTRQISTHYGMCGGSIYNAKTFLKVYNDVVEDIKNNMDRMMEAEPASYKMLGAVDANITYHFAKRGYKYEVALWLGEVREGRFNLPVIHQWKEHY